ncbi:hypothetical protein PMZ80_010748 [Knufia obscura]|uniref:Nonribosomal peptide synthetase 12 n=1 Tax=Knufia obscura TaxID=1635080 RepID=A0ABR0RA33_9EURO|nr:hypothetical protein PMZ80_010748 [Knufia obscura]
MAPFPSHRHTRRAPEAELTKWLPDIYFINIGMDWSAAGSAPLWPRSVYLDPEKALIQRKEILSNESFASSTSTLTAGKQMQHLEDLQLPRKKYGRIHRNLRFTFFSVYRRLNLFVVLSNLIIIAVFAALHRLLSIDAQLLGTAAAANITASVLIRQELVINLLFASFGKCPQSFPLRIRRLAAKIYHLGGVHSGAGIAATIWFGILNVPIVKAWLHDPLHDFHTAILVITLLLDVLLVSIVVFSHPYLRTKFHNTWEAIHRFAGWTAVGLFWAHMILPTEANRRQSSPDIQIAQLLIRNPIFWCLFTVTIALVLPWLRLQKVPVRAVPLSDHAVRLHFGYTNLPLCAAPRFSDSPLTEWHAFAGIPEEDGMGFSVLVSKAGDWTSKIIQSPPKELWTRGIPARGVLHIAPIFRKMVLVATGSGIGPVLSLLYARNLNARIMWSTPDPVSTYQQAIVDQILLADPNALIINTSKSGRPDLAREAYKLYRSSQAEAVFIISNPKVTRKVVYALESRGVPIFAPIFDS